MDGSVATRRDQLARKFVEGDGVQSARSVPANELRVGREAGSSGENHRRAGGGGGGEEGQGRGGRGEGEAGDGGRVELGGGFESYGCGGDGVQGDGALRRG